jgi:hypothetical protein
MCQDCLSVCANIFKLKAIITLAESAVFLTMCPFKVLYNKLNYLTLQVYFFLYLTEWY